MLDIRSLISEQIPLKYTLARHLVRESVLLQGERLLRLWRCRGRHTYSRRGDDDAAVRYSMSQSANDTFIDIRPENVVCNMNAMIVYLVLAAAASMCEKSYRREETSRRRTD